MSFAEKQTLRSERLVQAGLFGNLSGTSSPRNKNGWIQYTVRKGDTLEKIAQEHGVSVADLKVWNGLRTSRIRVGQGLDIYSDPEERTSIITNSMPRRREAPPTDTNSRARAQASPPVRIHEVKQGETLWKIAKMYGVTVKDLEQYNDLADVLKPGDRITIPLR
jgi:membrane-bound lytic murein transglycosylase D